MTRPQVTIYTDGSAKPNPGGPGGWAALLIRGEHQRELSGAEPGTTNNRMELTAAIMALEALREPCLVTLYTDSPVSEERHHPVAARLVAQGLEDLGAQACEKPGSVATPARGLPESRSPLALGARARRQPGKSTCRPPRQCRP